MQTLVQQYKHLRNTGLDARAAIKALQPAIQALEPQQRDQLLQYLRTLEQSNANDPARPKSEPVRKIQTPQGATDTHPTKPKIQPISMQSAPQSAKDNGKIIACPACGKANSHDAIFCYSCGQILINTNTAFDTRQLGDDQQEALHDAEYFGGKTTLIIIMQESKQGYKIRPQSKEHEVLIGRSAGGAIAPDIDLAPHNAAELGVSRMHLSLNYNEKQNAILATDINSANGTFINGQRLYPQEIRILRHGDEIRLGKLKFNVYFQHPEA